MFNKIVLSLFLVTVICLALASCSLTSAERGYARAAQLNAVGNSVSAMVSSTVPLVTLFFGLISLIICLCFIYVMVTLKKDLLEKRSITTNHNYFFPEFDYSSKRDYYKVIENISCEK